MYNPFTHKKTNNTASEKQVAHRRTHTKALFDKTLSVVLSVALVITMSPTLQVGAFAAEASDSANAAGGGGF